MNAQLPQSPRPAHWPWFLIVAGAAMLAVTPDSFWIDEFATTLFVTKSSLSACWQAMIDVRFPELQAPLYMAYMWACAQLFGTGEWVMRAVAVPWLILGAIIFVTIIGRLTRALPVVALVLSFNAFVWYYLNEARVYAFQLGFALAVIAAAIEIGRTTNGLPRAGSVRLFAVALVGLCGSSVLGAVWGFCIFLALAIAVPRTRWRPMLSLAPVTVLVAAICLAGLAVYYAWTIHIGPRASAVGTTTIQTVGFAAYELLGTTGLGPGRHTLRELGARALQPHAIGVGLYLAVMAWVLARGLGTAAGSLPRARGLAIAILCLTPIVLLIVVGVATRFRMLGRHLTPALPLVLCLFSLGLARMLQGRTFERMLIPAFLALGLLSCLEIRFAERHRKDDYRSAAALANHTAERGAHVWWNADAGGIWYYGLSRWAEQTPPRLSLLINPANENLAQLAPPDLIVASKPDVYDQSGAVRAYLQAHQFRLVATLPAFSIWAAQPRR